MSDCDRPLRCVLLSTLLGVMALLGGCSAKPVVPATEFPEPVLVRVHSECLTGDVFGSRRCDCGDHVAGE